MPCPEHDSMEQEPLFVCCDHKNFRRKFFFFFFCPINLQTISQSDENIGANPFKFQPFNSLKQEWKTISS